MNDDAKVQPNLLNSNSLLSLIMVYCCRLDQDGMPIGRGTLVE